MNNPPLPVYDWHNRPKSPFAWVLEQAARVRAERNADALMAEARRREQRAREYRPVQEHEADR